MNDEGAEQGRVQQVPAKKLVPQWNPFMLRRFVTHLSVAARKYESKSAAKQELQTKLQQIKKLALNKRSKKNQVVEVFTDFEEMLLQIMKDEKVLLEEQRKETHELNTLRQQVSDLNAKLIELGNAYTKELEEKDKKILQLKESLASLHIRISEDKTSAVTVPTEKSERQGKVDGVEARVKGRSAPQEPVAQLEEQLAALEQKHKELAKSGRHSKEDLARVKKIIDAHKKKIQELKK